MASNPWLVDDIEAFSFYCCPECVFRSKEDNVFQAHALQNHVQSKAFFHGENYANVKEEFLEIEPDLDLKTEDFCDTKIDGDQLDIKLEINEEDPDTEVKEEITETLDYFKKAHNDQNKKVKVTNSSDKKNEQKIWTEGVFSAMSPSSLNFYKRNWERFCSSSYQDQQKSPTEEMYVDFFKKKKEAGRTDKALWTIYLALKKVAYHCHGQKLQNYTKVKELLTYADKERPQGKKTDDPGVCPHCGDVSTFITSLVYKKCLKNNHFKK